VDPGSIHEDALALLQARESRLVVSDQIKAEREAAIVDTVIDKQFPPEARRRWARRLSEMAFIFRATDREEPAQLAECVAAALADPDRAALHDPVGARPRDARAHDGRRGRPRSVKLAEVSRARYAESTLKVSQPRGDSMSWSAEASCDPRRARRPCHRSDRAHRRDAVPRPSRGGGVEVRPGRWGPWLGSSTHATWRPPSTALVLAGGAPSGLNPSGA
jgi:hypothetical protein